MRNISACYFFGALILGLISNAQASGQYNSKSVDIYGDFLRAVQRDIQSGERKGSADLFINNLKKSGVVNSGADWEQDFSDYYGTKKKTTFLGFDVAFVVHEYAKREVKGCCADPGIVLVLETGSSTKILDRFAEKNGCAFIENVSLDEYRFPKTLMVVPGKKYSELHCSRTYLQMKLIGESPIRSTRARWP